MAPRSYAEHGHRDAPALADLPDEVLPRHADVLEEHLAELALAGDLAQWPDRHAGRVELAQDERDTAVAVGAVGARQHEDPVRPRPQRGPDLLAVQHEVIAVEDGAGAQRREVAAGAGLAEALAPELFGREHRRNVAPPLLLGAVVDQSRRQQPDAEEVGDLRSVGPRQLFLEDRLLHLGGAAAAPLRRPVHSQVARLEELALPLAAHLHQAVLGRLRIAQLFAPRSLQVLLQPGAQLVAKLQMRIGQLEIHGRSF